MKRISLFLLLFLLLKATVMYSQDGHPETNFRIVPVSPNAASLGTFGMIPTDNYVGQANLTIPIYEIDLDGKKFPIALSYHTDGTRVAQEATWIGLGWTLQAGGCVVRQVWRVSQGNCWRMWSVGSSMASGSRGLLAECGLSGQVWRVGQENCWRSVVCRGEIAEWVKKIVGGVWSVGAKRASGSRGLLAECGLSGRKCCVGQRNWRRSVVCRGEKGEWVKGIVGRVWSVGAKRASGSRELLAECGLSGQVCCVGQRNWRRRVVCRVKFVEWVKGIVGGVWSVGTSMASGSKELSTECGLSGQVWRVGQRNCRQSLVCRGEKGEWVKRPVGGFGLSGQVWRVGQENCWRSVVCRVKYGE